MTSEPIDDCDATPAEFQVQEMRMAEMDAQIDQLLKQGWKWSERDPINRQLAHPDDPELNLWFDPYTGECFMSRKLVSKMKESFARDGLPS